MEADEVIQAKQNLLQSEIIDKNYDKTAFINFCLSKKENGDDLNNWTLEELTEIVTEFVKNQKIVKRFSVCRNDFFIHSIIIIQIYTLAKNCGVKTLCQFYSNNQAFYQSISAQQAAMSETTLMSSS